MAEVAIRPLQAGDEAEWRRLWTAYLEFYESSVPEEVYRSTFARILAGNGGANDEIYGLVAEADGLLTRLFYGQVSGYLPAVNTTRQSFGLAPLGTAKDLVDEFHRADLRLIQTTEAFDFPITPAPANARYVGPVLDDPDWTGAWQNPWPEDDARPLVVASLSSTFQNQREVLRFYRRIGLQPVVVGEDPPVHQRVIARALLDDLFLRLLSRGILAHTISASPLSTLPVSTTVCTCLSATTTSTFTLGTKSTAYSVPRYISVCPFCRPNWLPGSPPSQSMHFRFFWSSDSHRD